MTVSENDLEDGRAKVNETARETLNVHVAVKACRCRSISSSLRGKSNATKTSSSAR